MKQVQPGTVIDERFEVLNEVGQGGMGVVYRARQANMERDVALKLLKTGLAGNPDKVSRFQREARIISVLEHKNIVQIYAVGLAEEGQPYIAMEFLTGRQLSDIVHEQGALHWRRAVEYTIQICDALQYAHQNNIIHRDIKPSNVVVCGDGTADGAVVKLVDFGIAKSLVEAGPALTQTEMVIGSAFYLSPGQFQGRASDPTSDIYSLGCTLFEALAGRPPFVGDTIYDTVAKQATEALPQVNRVNPEAKIPDELQRVLERMTAKNSEDRIATPAEVKDYLQKVLQGLSVDLVSPTSAAPRPRKHSSLKKVAICGVLSIASMCAVAASMGFIGHRAPSEFAKAKYLVDSEKERELVDSINALTGTDPSTPKLSSEYRELASMYSAEDMQLPAYYCALESIGVNGAPRPGKMHSTWLAGEILYRLGRYRDAMYLLHALAIDPKTEISWRNLTYITIIKAAAQEGNFAVGSQAVHLLEPSIRTQDENYAIPVLIIGTGCDLQAGAVNAAQQHLKQLEERLADRNPSDLLVVRSQIYKLELQRALKKPLDQSLYKYVLQAPRSSSNALAYLGMPTAHLMAGNGDAQKAVELIHDTTDLLLVMPAPTSKLAEEIQSAAKTVELTIRLLPKELRPKAEAERKRLVDRFLSLKEKLNDVTIVVPVPVPDWRRTERDLLSS